MKAKLAEPSAPQRRRPLALIAVIAVAAAAASVAVAHQRPLPRAVATLQPARLVSAPSTVRGDELQPGALVRADANPVVVIHAGHARWTLAAHSDARLLQRGDVVRVELVRGTLDAVVEPRPTPETFVVETGEVRVAVHGTEFQVRRVDASVAVEVREGVVAVGQRQAAAELTLVAPASAHFAADGTGLMLDRDAAGVSARPAPPQRPSSLPPHRTAPPPSALPGEPSIGDVEAGVSRIQVLAQGCFARHTSAGEGVQVSAQSRVELRVRPDGAVTVEAFEPPLAPGVEGCVRAELARVRFTASQRGIQLSRTLELRR